MEKSIQIAWKIVPLRHFFPLKVVPLIEVLRYSFLQPFAGSLLLFQLRTEKYDTKADHPMFRIVKAVGHPNSEDYGVPSFAQDSGIPASEFENSRNRLWRFPTVKN
jgi:hypothetical protein